MEMTGYSGDVKEKVRRLGGILAAFGEAEILRGHLSLYGGTAINLLHMEQAPRLSEDLDFNYRHRGEGDWGERRDEIDVVIKSVLDRLGYSDEDIRIQPQYNLNRFYVRYVTEDGKKDLVKIEMGYMRRIPVLKEDTSVEFRHAGLPRSVAILTPRPEELFANKFCTMFSRMRRRKNARDVFDVGTISGLEFDHDLFLDVLMIESILMDLPYSEMRFLPLDGPDLEFLERMLMTRPDLEMLNDKAERFSARILAELEKKDIIGFQSAFNGSGEVRLDLLNDPDQIHADISVHPQLLWLREKRGRVR